MLDPVALLVGGAPVSAVAPDPRPAVPASSAVTLSVVGAATGVPVATLAVAAAGLSPVAPVTVAALSVALCTLPA